VEKTPGWGYGEGSNFKFFLEVKGAIIELERLAVEMGLCA